MSLAKLLDGAHNTAKTFKKKTLSEVKDGASQFDNVIKNTLGQLRGVGTQYETNAMKGIAGVGDLTQIVTSTSEMELNVKFIRSLLTEFLEVFKEITQRTPI